MSAMAPCRQTASVVVRTIQGSRRSARNLAKHKGANAVADLRAGIPEGFSNQVCEVNTFAEKVTGNGCLRWRDTHTLREDTHEVGEARPVPEQLLVAEIVGIVDGSFAVALHRKAVNDIQAQVLLRRVQVPLDHLIGGAARLQLIDIAPELPVVCVDGICRELC